MIFMGLVACQCMASTDSKRGKKKFARVSSALGDGEDDEESDEDDEDDEDEEDEEYGHNEQQQKKALTWNQNEHTA